VWRKSGRCDSGTCVEIASSGDGVAMRDSKEPDGPVLHIARDQWTDFLAGVRAGHFG
jgi:hypothetical protein